MWFEKNLGRDTFAKVKPEEISKRKEIRYFMTDKKLKTLNDDIKLILRFRTNPKKNKACIKKNFKLNKCFYCCRLLACM
jgi:hypothetical protein